MKKRIVVVGGGGFGREIACYLTSEIEAGVRADVELAGVVDSNPTCEVTRCSLNLRHLGDLETLQDPSIYSFLIALDSVPKRRSFALTLKQMGMNVFIYVHSSAIDAADAMIGAGTVNRECFPAHGTGWVSTPHLLQLLRGSEA